MARFFVSEGNISGDTAYLSGEDAEHVRVLRIRDGELFTVCDGAGTDYICRLRCLTSDRAEAEIVEKLRSAGEPTVACTVFAAFPKGDKAETIIQKSVELGAAGIVFFPSARCVSRPDAAKKLRRWNKISEEASKQSGRGVIPEVSALPSFDAMLARASAAELGMFFYEASIGCGIKNVLKSAGGFTSVSAVTGPEGGFEPEEVALAREKGLLITGLGSRILRCETAPVCALAAIMFHTDNL